MDAHREKLIDDYLFNRETTFDSDQQFAKPIEDEDMFGSMDCDKAQNTGSDSSSKRSRLREQYKELAKGMVPKKLGADCDEDGMISIDIEVPKEQLEEQSSAKEIFRKAQLRRVKDKYGLYKGQKLVWDKYNDYLQRKISADKRKRWESVHGPLDKYDDEEELICPPSEA